MTGTVFLCRDGLPPVAGTGLPEGFTAHSLRIAGPEQNINRQLDHLEARIVEDLEPLVFDLLDLATYVYIGDTSVSRGRIDLYGNKWCRNLIFRVPVRRIERWNQNCVRERLDQLLTYLSGDATINVEFYPHQEPNKPPRFLRFEPNTPGFQGASVVSLFSGGLDSLAGAVSQILRTSGKPLLVSHRPVSTIMTRQEVAARAIQRKLGVTIPRISVWISRKGTKFIDANQRMRSFLYMALGAGIALQLGISEVHYCENGITTFNPPISEQRIGARSTRTTRPRVLNEFTEICRSVFEKPMEITNPFVFKTKSEVIEVLKEASVEELIGDTVSCSRTIGVRRETPHCGVCYQCIVRRFAVIASNTGESDPISHYAKDIFVHPLNEGEERANALDWVRFNQGVEQMTREDFYAKFSDLQDSFDALGDNAAQTGEAIYDLFQRNARQSRAVWEKQIRDKSGKIYRGEVSASSLLGLVACGSIKSPPIAGYTQKVMAIIERGLRAEYSERTPAKEREVQQSIKACLAAAEEKLHKEYPTFAYSIGAARPDFSEASNRLFIEAKLLKDSAKRTALVDQIIADIEKYSTACEGILFVIFQRPFIITDLSELTSPFENRKHVFFKLIP
jgi:7-cyano-7-deazaguanine synthase in queuosine biosynthesis